ncbi:hypothetical protein FQA39_LY14882 [Lamprigera yunnana]|nr:hypothetical protein FQA39_LY14882 [Lamprigera yunnana]
MFYYIFSIIVFGAAVYQVYAVPCNCGLGRGDNVCADGHHYPLVVRPQHLPKIEIEAQKGCQEAGESGAAPLKPIGGLCSSGRTIITPGFVPRPACAGCNGGFHSVLEKVVTEGLEKTHHSSSSLSSHTHTIHSDKVGGIVLDHPIDGLHHRHSHHGSRMPADAISQSLAYKQFHDKHHAVDQDVQYGFKSVPKEVTPVHNIKVKFGISKNTFSKCFLQHTVREENIYRHNGEVLELGKLHHGHHVDHIIELEEEEEELEPEPQHAHAHVHQVTLGDLGFIPSHHPKTQFTNVEVVPSVVSGVDSVSKCDDGYKAGQVIVKEERVIPSISIHRKRIPLNGDEGNPKYFSGPTYAYSAHHHSHSSNSNSNSDHHSYHSKGHCL